MYNWLVVLVAMVVPVVSAAEVGVVINELMWDGVEYVELYNASEDEVSLAGWVLTRQKREEEPEKIITTFDDEDTVSAESYWLIEKKEDATAAAADKIVSGLTLVNTGELVRLKDEAGGLVDSANQLGEWLAGENTSDGVAMERSADGWHTATGSVGGRAGTPGEENSEAPVNEAPEAEISASGDEFLIGEVAEFSGEDSSDGNGDELTYAWDFGDGEVGEGVEVVHGYSTAGTVTVTLTVSDGELTGVDALEVVVEAPEYSDEVVVNELLPNPVGSDTSGEFVELYNDGRSAVDLGGWELDDAEGGSGAYTIPAGVSLAAGGYVSFSRSVTKLALNNGGDSARLLDPAGEVKSSFTYDESVDEGVAWAKDGEKWKLTTTPTAGSANAISTPVSDEDKESEDEEDEEGGEVEFSDAIEIYALLPNPVGSDAEGEYIELINTGSSDVSLYGWELDDEEGGSSAYAIGADTTIEAGEVRRFGRGETGIALNNNGDRVRLFDPRGTLIDEFRYDESVAEGVVLPEAGAGEGQVAGESVKTVALKDIRSEEEGTMVTTQGVVSARPGVLGKGVLYLAGSGIQVYFSEDEYPEVQLGDTVEVTGELASYLGESRLKLAVATDITKLAAGEAPVPHGVKTGEVDEAMEGTLVVVIGRIAKTSGDTFYIDDGSGEIKVFIKESTGIEKPKMKKGDLFTIVGVVSQTQSGYRILPRSQEDVHEGAVAGLKSFPASGLRSSSYVRQAGPQGFEALGLALAGLWLPFLLRRASYST